MIVKHALNVYVGSPAKLTITLNEDEVLIEFGLLMLINLILKLFAAFNWLTINPVNLSVVVKLTVVTVGEVSKKDP